VIIAAFSTSREQFREHGLVPSGREMPQDRDAGGGEPCVVEGGARQGDRRHLQKGLLGGVFVGAR
jgi:hypothetical protein